MGPAPISPRALHGWALEASSCSFRSCRVGTSIVRVLSWAKPCSASWDLRVLCAFLKKKYIRLGVAPEPLAIWNKELEGLTLKSFWFFVEGLPSIYPVFFKKELGYSSVRVLFIVSPWSGLSWRSLLGDMRFFEEKSALTECSPRASCYLEQKVRGSWILCCLKTPVLKKSSEWCALFWRKSALTECSPRASCYLEQRVGGSWIWVVQRTENFSCCSLRALFKKNSDTKSWHIL